MFIKNGVELLETDVWGDLEIPCLISIWPVDELSRIRDKDISLEKMNWDQDWKEHLENKNS